MDGKVRRRHAVATALVVLPLGALACEGGQAAAPAPTEVAATATPPGFQIQVQMIPQEARLGTDENVVCRCTFRRLTGGQMRPVSGAQIEAVAAYPGGPQKFTHEVTTFPDGRAPDLAIPVAPAQRAGNVRVEVTMRYQGQEFKQAAGFTVR